MSLLIVEDDPSLLKLLTVLVERRNIPVETASSGCAALKAIECGRHDAVILDLMLPGMTGFEILRSIRATRPQLLSRIIVLTAVAQRSLDRELDAQSSVWTILRKPFEIEELTKAVEECVAYHAPRDVPTRAEVSTWLESQCSIVGASGAVIIAMRSASERLELRAWCGFTHSMIDNVFPVSLAERYPICSSARTGDPVWLASFKNLQFPLLQMWKSNHGAAGAAAPLRGDQFVSGSIGFLFSQLQEFDDAQREQLLGIARKAFQIIRPSDQPQIN